MLALVMVSSAMLLALALGKAFGWDIGLTAGMLAGAMTSTPVLVGAGDTLRQSMSDSPLLGQMQDHLSLGYALTYGRHGQPDLRRPLPAAPAASGSAYLRAADRPRTRSRRRQPAKSLSAGDPRLPRRP